MAISSWWVFIAIQLTCAYTRVGFEYNGTFYSRWLPFAIPNSAWSGTLSWKSPDIMSVYMARHVAIVFVQRCRISALTSIENDVQRMVWSMDSVLLDPSLKQCSVTVLWCSRRIEQDRMTLEGVLHSMPNLYLRKPRLQVVGSHREAMASLHEVGGTTQFLFVIQASQAFTYTFTLYGSVLTLLHSKYIKAVKVGVPSTDSHLALNKSFSSIRLSVFYKHLPLLFSREYWAQLRQYGYQTIRPTSVTSVEEDMSAVELSNSQEFVARQSLYFIYRSTSVMSTGHLSNSSATREDPWTNRGPLYLNSSFSLNCALWSYAFMCIHKQSLMWMCPLQYPIFALRTRTEDDRVEDIQWETRRGALNNYELDNEIREGDADTITDEGHHLCGQSYQLFDIPDDEVSDTVASLLTIVITIGPTSLDHKLPMTAGAAFSSLNLAPDCRKARVLFSLDSRVRFVKKRKCFNPNSHSREDRTRFYKILKCTDMMTRNNSRVSFFDSQSPYGETGMAAASLGEVTTKYALFLGDDQAFAKPLSCYEAVQSMEDHPSITYITSSCFHNIFNQYYQLERDMTWRLDFPFLHSKTWPAHSHFVRMKFLRKKLNQRLESCIWKCISFVDWCFTTANSSAEGVVVKGWAGSTPNSVHLDGREHYIHVKDVMSAIAEKNSTLEVLQMTMRNPRAESCAEWYFLPSHAEVERWINRGSYERVSVEESSKLRECRKCGEGEGMFPT